MVKKKVKVEVAKDEKPRGIAKSGKFWKTPSVPIRKIQNTMPKKSKAQHLEYRNEIKRIKALSNSIKEDKKQVRINRSLSFPHCEMFVFPGKCFEKATS